MTTNLNASRLTADDRAIWERLTSIATPSHTLRGRTARRVARFDLVDQTDARRVARFDLVDQTDARRMRSRMQAGTKGTALVALAAWGMDDEDFRSLLQAVRS